MGWMFRKNFCRLAVAGEVFFLDIPFYRTHYMCPAGAAMGPDEVSGRDRLPEDRVLRGVGL
jgi:hypothetical protein